MLNQNKIEYKNISLYNFLLLAFIVSIHGKIIIKQKNYDKNISIWERKKIFCQQIRYYDIFIIFFVVESGSVKVFSDNHLWCIVSMVAQDIRNFSEIRWPDIWFICRISGKISYWCHNFNMPLYKPCSHAASYHLVSGSFDEYKWTWHVHTTDLMVSCVPLATIPVYQENPDPVVPAGPTHILSQI